METKILHQFTCRTCHFCQHPRSCLEMKAVLFQFSIYGLLFDIVFRRPWKNHRMDVPGVSPETRRWVVARSLTSGVGTSWLHGRPWLFLYVSFCWCCLPGTPRPTINKPVVSIGWWTKSLHRKWMEMVVSPNIHFKLVVWGTRYQCFCFCLFFVDGHMLCTFFAIIAAKNKSRGVNCAQEFCCWLCTIYTPDISSE